MVGAGPETIYCDARALQDPNFRFRGVGQHAASLLSSVRSRLAEGEGLRLIALVHPAAEPLHAEHRLLFDEVRTEPRRAEYADASFLSLSPMTHDPTWVAPLLLDDGLHRIALFYDLIPLSMPNRYLAGAQARVDYVAALAWLRRYQTFASISQYSADHLIEALGISRTHVFVSGVAVRSSLEPARGEVPLPRSDRRWIVVAGGGDPRKNPECAIRAHARSGRFRSLPLVVFGNYPANMQSEMMALHGAEGGTPGGLVFRNGLSDRELHQLYREAMVTVVPSRAEGFSIPIVESNAAGTPVAASDVGAHPELVRDRAARFNPDDPDELRLLLEKLANSEEAWTALQQGQGGLWRDYTTDAVGDRFVRGVLARTPLPEPEAPTVRRGARPQVAVLSPLPPALSGVAHYTAATLRPATEHVDLHMYTETADAEPEAGWRSLLPLSGAAYGLARLDALVGVMGNSHHHTGVFRHLLDHGGACIAHDARQIDFYVHVFGAERACAVASAELGRPVSEPELMSWLGTQRNLPTLFLSELLDASSPMFVHSPLTANLMGELYGRQPITLPFAQYRGLGTELADPAVRKHARSRLGVKPGEVLLVTFGQVYPDKAPLEIVWCLRWLVTWGVNATLAFCGPAARETSEWTLGFAERLGMPGRIRFFDKPLPEEAYRDYLAAADIGIQLRTYGLGGLSGALNDCIAAAIPSISNAHLAEAMRAPSFVRTVPDMLSPLLMAEAAMDILDSGHNEARPVEEAASFAEEHSPRRYSELLLQGLGFDVARRAA